MRAFRTALPFALALLVVVLGVFQYRWLGQVAEIERQEMRASLERRAQDFASEFNRDITSLYTALSVPPPPPGADSASRSTLTATTVAGYKQWRGGARFPELVKGLYLFSRATPDAVKRIDLDSGAETALPFPAALAPAIEAIGSISGAIDRQPNGGERTRVVALGGSPFVSRIPALVIWLPDRLPFRVGAVRLPDAPPNVDIMLRPAAGEQALIVELDRRYVRDVMLPALVDRYFPTEDGGPIARQVLVERGAAAAPARLQIVDAAGEALLARGLGSGESIAADRADVVVPFFIPGADGLGTPGVRVMQWTDDQRESRLHGEVAVRVERRGQAAPIASTNEHFFTLPIESWSVRVQHAAGSLDAAVAIGRRRNLALGFGILGVLGAAVVLVIGNARRAERLAAQQLQFVAAVSHELRTPLAVIRSAAENISAGIVKDPDQTVRYGQLIESEGRRLTEMIEHVLSHAGIGLAGRRQLRTRPVDLGAIVADAVAGTKSLAAQAGCEVAVNVEPDVPQAMSDETSLRSAIENLLTNAIKHAGEGRFVGVSVAGAGPGGTGDGDDGSVEIRVTDKGPGVDPADLPHIFEPFHRGRRAVDRQTPGSGLGLSVVKRSIESLGGRVTYEPLPDGGSAFSIVVPAAPSDVEPPRPA